MSGLSQDGSVSAERILQIEGIGHICQEFVKAGTRHLISSSGGNAGLAVAYSAKRLGVRTTVIVPKTTPDWVCKKIEAEGAQVNVVGAVWDEAHEAALKLAAEKGSAYISPFDHPLIWHGHSTMIDEVAQDHGKPGAIVLAVGGGGLMCGVLEGMHRAGWTDVPVIAVETEGTASFAASVKRNSLVTIDKITGIASSLGARRVANEAFEWSKKHPITSSVVSDRTALNACLRFANDHRTLVEPACGAALSVLYDKVHLPTVGHSVVAIVCGGAVVNLDRLREWDKNLS